jgi:hypothetical protein
MPLQSLVGVKKATDGSVVTARGTTLGSTVTSNLRSYFCTAAERYSLYTDGLTATATVAGNAIATAVDATVIPLVGIWNPPNTNTMVAIESATIAIDNTANSAGFPGGFMWMYATSQSGITTGVTATRVGDLNSSISRVKGFQMSIPLTGLVGSLSVLRAVAVSPGLNAAGDATAVSRSYWTTEDVEGTVLVPPGCVVVIMSQLSMTTTLTISTGLDWQEFPLP